MTSKASNSSIVAWHDRCYACYISPFGINIEPWPPSSYIEAFREEPFCWQFKMIWAYQKWHGRRYYRKSIRPAMQKRFAGL